MAFIVCSYSSSLSPQRSALFSSASKYAHFSIFKAFNSLRLLCLLLPTSPPIPGFTPFLVSGQLLQYRTSLACEGGLTFGADHYTYNLILASFKPLDCK